MPERRRQLPAALRREPLLTALVLLQVLLLAAQAVLWHARTAPLHLSPEAGLTAYGSGQVTAAGVENTEPGTFATTNWCALRAGMYRMTAQYQADADAEGTLSVYSTLALADSSAPVTAAGTQTSLTVWLPQRVDNLQLHFFAGQGHILIQAVDIEPLNNNAMLLGQLFVFALFDLLWLLFRRRLPALRGRRAARAVLVLAAAAFAAAPAFSTTLFYGDDLIFHLNRIEGLAQELLAGGGLPVYLQSRWFGGQGYPVSVFYCDAFLYLPALLRVLGFPLQSTLQIYMTAVTTATAAAAYWAFWHIFRSDTAAALGCTLYTLAPYRLFDMFGRSALGEYTALAFAPLILAGLWDIYTLDPADARYCRCWVPVALGYAGVVQSHLLSTEMLALFTFALCLLCLRRTLRPATLAALCKGAGGAALLSLWYLVPLADYMRRGDFAVSETGWRDLQNAGATLGQLLQIFASGAGRGKNLQESVCGDMPQGPGLALLLALLLFALYLLLRPDADPNAGKTPLWQAAAAGALGGGAALALCLWTTPWNLVQRLPLLGTVLGTVQFPWRYLGLACLLLTLMACALPGLARPYAKGAAPLLAAALALCCVLEAGYTMSTGIDGAAPVVFCDAGTLDSYRCGDGEYLPAGVGTGDVYALPQQPQGDGVQVTEFVRAGAACTLHAAAPAGGTLELPLLGYPGYRAQAGAQTLPVGRSAQGQLAVTLPAGFDGAVEVRFAPPWYWYAAAAVSALAALGAVLWAVRQRRRQPS